MSNNLDGEKYTCPRYLSFPIHPDQAIVHRVISINKNDFKHWVWRDFVTNKYILSSVVMLTIFNFKSSEEGFT